MGWMRQPRSVPALDRGWPSRSTPELETQRRTGIERSSSIPSSAVETTAIRSPRRAADPVEFFVFVGREGDLFYAIGGGGRIGNGGPDGGRTSEFGGGFQV